MRRRNSEITNISQKLDILIRLVALSLVKELKTQKEQIALLSDAGFQPKQIAEILGTTSNTVRVALHSIKKEREARESKKASEEKIMPVETVKVEENGA